MLTPREREVLERTGAVMVGDPEWNDEVDNTKMNSQPQGLITRKHWEDIYHQPCRVSHFNPLPPARVEGGKIVSKNSGLPYAIVTLECPKCPPEVASVKVV